MDLKNLSQHLGLSQTTVSRALNGYPEVSEKTRLRVRQAAQELGYRPNHAARRLATGKATAIGFVLETGESVQSDPHFMEFLAGIGEQASREGLDIHIAPCAAGDEAATYHRLASTRLVDAVIITSPTHKDKRIELLQSIDLPFIVHGRSEEVAHPYSHLDVDNFGAFQTATELLIQMGHRRIALINGPQSMTFANHRQAGYQDALRAAGMEQDPGIVFRNDMSEEYGYRCTIALVDSSAPPTALLCSSIIVALGAIRALSDRGLTPGPDVSVIAHDDVFPYLQPENFRVPLTCTRSPIRKAGLRIAERLSAILSHREAPGTGEVWPVELIVRKSVAPPRMR